jgi:hypothetical protein
MPRLGLLDVNGLLTYKDHKPIDEDIFLEQTGPYQYYYKTTHIFG